MRSPNLKVIFDMSNLVDAGNVGAQDSIWNDVGELLGNPVIIITRAIACAGRLAPPQAWRTA